MPTFPVTLPCGTRVRLRAPQWDLLCRLTRALERRPLLETWLLQDLLPTATQVQRRMVAHLADQGVLERRPTGYHLPVRVRAQVCSAEAGTPSRT